MRSNPRSNIRSARTARTLVGAVVLAATPWFACACAAPQWAVSSVSLGPDTPSATSAGGKPVSQAELQEELQRFTGQFMDSLAQATWEVVGTGPPNQVSNTALRQGLLYMASTLDIANEPLPGVGVLDMVVFVQLSRDVLTRYWVPEVYGERGRPFVDAFDSAEPKIWAIADKILPPNQRPVLIELIDAWQRENPDQVRVEGVRLTEFSYRAGAVAAERAQAIRGLVSSVEAAIATANEAILLAERGVFFASRMPFLLRLQVRLAAREILSDTAAMLESSKPVATGLHDLEPVLAELPALVRDGKEAAHEGRLLIRDLAPLKLGPEGVERLGHLVGRANELTLNTTAMLRHARASLEDLRSGITARADSVLRRALAYLILLGAAWSALWWGGYVVAKRLVPRQSRSRQSRRATRRAAEARS